ncbi:hypothetical protein [Rhodococcus sovatensis]|uniref:Uncharacterized protein n=1 Tax=Rhodococcus sovatensis TaxID=1805840 RepID=A0ABZ2PQ02_9NOCA
MKNQLFVSVGRLTADAIGASDAVATPDVRVMPVVRSSAYLPTARYGIAVGFGDSVLGAIVPEAGNPSAAASVADALQAATLSPAQWSAFPACANPASANPAARHRLAHATSVIEDLASREVSTE